MSEKQLLVYWFVQVHGLIKYKFCNVCVDCIIICLIVYMALKEFFPMYQSVTAVYLHFYRSKI